MVKNFRKLNFNFVDVTFSPTLAKFLTISKINIKLSNDIRFMKKKNFNSFYNKNSLPYVFEDTKLNSVQIFKYFIVLLLKITQIAKKELHFINK